MSISSKQILKKTVVLCYNAAQIKCYSIVICGEQLKRKIGAGGGGGDGGGGGVDIEEVEEKVTIDLQCGRVFVPKFCFFASRQLSVYFRLLTSVSLVNAFIAIQWSGLMISARCSILV